MAKLIGNNPDQVPTNGDLGTLAFQDSDNVIVENLTSSKLVVEDNSTDAALRVTQTGTGNALVVEDSANPDSTPFVVDASGNVGIGTDSPRARLHVSNSPSPATVSEIALATYSSVGSKSSSGGYFLGYGVNDGGGQTTFNSTTAVNIGRTAIYTTSGNIYFATGVAETTTVGSSVVNMAERMCIDSSGNVVFGNDGLVPADSAIVNAKVINASDGYILRSHRSVTTATNHIYFFNPNGLCGKIETSGASTSYVTSSDYRLKENITEITDGITRVKQLNPSRFNFIADPDIIVDGFLAHEVQGIVPEAISGEKDAVNEDGSINPQGIDQSKLVPLLTAALQEAIGLIESQQSQIDALTARIEALEA
jgi:hypothetical protein